MKLQSLATILACGSLLVTGCVGEIDDVEEGLVETHPIEGRSINGRSINGLVYNAILTDRTTLRTLVSNSLSSKTFSWGNEKLRARASTPASIGFLDYLVQCALSPEQEPVTRTSPYDAGTSTHYGMHGFCPQWADGPVLKDSACTQKVSACLLSRVNGLDTHVILSHRGKDALGYPVAMEKPATASTIDARSTEDCSGSSSSVNCGWQAGTVGTCTPGQSVTLSSPWYCSLRTWDVYRVCKNETTCDYGSSDYINTSYTCLSGGRTDFTCPARGRYSVMVRGYTPGTTASYRPVASGPGALAFPASEAQVFPHPEGAFYGDVFNVDPKIPDSEVLGMVTRVTWTPNGLNLGGYVTYFNTGLGWTKNPPVLNTPVYKKLFACHSDKYDYDTVHREMRVCATDDDLPCAAMHVGNCSSMKTHPKQEKAMATIASGACSIRDQSPLYTDGDYGKCVDPGEDLDSTADDVVYPHALTIYLVDMCDGMSPVHGGCKATHTPPFTPIIGRWVPNWSF